VNTPTFARSTTGLPTTACPSSSSTRPAGVCTQPARVIDDTPNLPGRGVVEPPTNSALFRDKRQQIDAVLIGTHDWYRERFAELGDDDRALAWERTPFMQRPFLDYSDRKWRLLIPRALDSWLSDGCPDSLTGEASEDAYSR